MTGAKKVTVNTPMIVKVQISLFTTAKTRQVRIYNKSRSVDYQGDCDKAILAVMRGEPKAFFKAKIKGEKIELLDHADWQGW